MIVSVDIDNTPTNTLNNDNINDNNNQNTNSQEQANQQTQTNDNNQTTTVNSSPSVRITGAPGAAGPVTGVQAPIAVSPAIITPPSTGSGGLLTQARESSIGARLLAVALTGVIAACVTAGGARVRSRK